MTPRKLVSRGKSAVSESIASGRKIAQEQQDCQHQERIEESRTLHRERSKEIREIKDRLRVLEEAFKKMETEK